MMGLAKDFKMKITGVYGGMLQKDRLLKQFEYNTAKDLTFSTKETNGDRFTCQTLTSTET